MATGATGASRKPARGVNLATVAVQLDKLVAEQQKQMEALARSLNNMQDLVIRVRRAINEEK